MVLACLAPLGCTQFDPDSPQVIELRERAVECLKRGVSYEYLATVRVQAIEALQERGGEAALPWIRQTLRDEVPAIRFAALLALGTHRDRVAEPEVRRLLDSEVTSDRLAAIFVLHRLGDTRYTAELASHLLEGDDIAGRRHAALILGLTGEEGAVKLLARAMREADVGLRANALEAMSLLGAEEARATLYANAYSGTGAEETFALTVLARTRDPRYREMYRQKLESALHLETKLAAARALGMLGDDEGFRTAQEALTYQETRDRRNDPAANRTLRVRQMAALACGAIGDPRALDRLEKMMNDADDPRLQVAAAKAILDILGVVAPPAMPFGRSATQAGAG